MQMLLNGAIPGTPEPGLNWGRSAHLFDYRPATPFGSGGTQPIPCWPSGQVCTQINFSALAASSATWARSNSHNVDIGLAP
jgi:hypothetical protein